MKVHVHQFIYSTSQLSTDTKHTNNWYDMLYTGKQTPMFKTWIKIIDWLHWYTMCSLFHHGFKICLENPVLSMYYHIGMMTVNKRSVLWKHVILVWKTGLRTFVWDASSPRCSQLVCPLALSPDPVVSWAWETVTRSDKFKRGKSNEKWVCTSDP